MSIPVLILGGSGEGKSTALRNLNPNDVLLIKVVDKPLPFKSTHWKNWDSATKTGSVIATDNSEQIINILNKASAANKKIVVIDDYNYLLSNEFMRSSKEKGFDKFTRIGKMGWDVIMAAQQAPGDIRVYILSHTRIDEHGNTKIKTIGKMLDEKIVVEGLFTIVLRAGVQDGTFFFTTQNNGRDTVKSPLGLFEGPKVDNDLLTIDKQICEYYGITQEKKS